MKINIISRKEYIIFYLMASLFRFHVVLCTIQDGCSWPVYTKRISQTSTQMSSNIDYFMLKLINIHPIGIWGQTIIYLKTRHQIEYRVGFTTAKLLKSRASLSNIFWYWPLFRSLAVLVLRRHLSYQKHKMYFCMVGIVWFKRLSQPSEYDSNSADTDIY